MPLLIGFLFVVVPPLSWAVVLYVVLSKQLGLSRLASTFHTFYATLLLTSTFVFLPLPLFPVRPHVVLLYCFLTIWAFLWFGVPATWFYAWVRSRLQHTE